ncbi:chorismate mutase [Rhodococcoides kyotonense]|uniref:Chorismate mutase n=1 Tax=Rhodococcoides kyotonense TaxID=398843 RepID=A0A239CHX8_9NOCA|nr:chorismate mutase [Rhodococcus kyotonensis]SNS19522.1 chorismate mutase [Rhodococcus kyotonensis]
MSGDTDGKLSSLRSELDAIDVRLMDAIKDRLEVCARVAHVKRTFDIPMMQPGRVGVVQERAREFARANDLSEEFLVSVYSVLIAEACRVEDAIIDAEDAGTETVGTGPTGVQPMNGDRAASTTRQR